MFTALKPSDQRQLLEIQLCQQEIVKIDVDVKNRLAAVRDTTGVGQRDLSIMCKDAKDRLNQMTAKVDQLEAIAQRVRKLADRAEVLAQVQKHRSEVDQNSQNLKRATLLAMQTLDNETREALFHPASSSLKPSLMENEPGLHMRNIQKRNLRNQNAQATDSLTRLVSKMGEQVSQSEKNLTTLAGTSQNIQESGKEFNLMGATIDSSGKLLSKYSRREMTDKILIALALCLFFGVVFYIVKKRMFGGIF